LNGAVAVISAFEVIEAENLAREQRMLLGRLVDIDVTKGGDPEACVRFRAAAHGDDPYKYETMLGRPKAGQLMAAGAIFFRRVA
jgi:hypothetical protein